MGDGRRELDRDVDGADVIIVDAYFSDSLPFHLVTKEFDELCARKLAPDGVVAVNFGGELTGNRNQLFWAALRTLGEVFPRVYVFSAELKAGTSPFKSTAIVIATALARAPRPRRRSPTAPAPSPCAWDGRPSGSGRAGSTRASSGSRTSRA